ncbi:hypothetical protein [Mycolicibacterium celeriflavum]|uniref:hypothetical protein n=1 Tax=Mycolicibacterium celeriflavum TaxID=1249101 RepID=UPI003CF9D240
MPDPLVLVREQVVPVLVDAGVLVSDERPAVVDAETTVAPPEPGEVQLRVESHERPEPAPPDSAPEPLLPTADIHVHIDRIDVVRPQPEPPPEPKRSAPRPRLVDHAEYLARRRDRR